MKGCSKAHITLVEVQRGKIYSTGSHSHYICHYDLSLARVAKFFALLYSFALQRMMHVFDNYRQQCKQLFDGKTVRTGNEHRMITSSTCGSRVDHAVEHLHKPAHCSALDVRHLLRMKHHQSPLLLVPGLGLLYIIVVQSASMAHNP
jgi:hypothetical protein